MMLIQRLGWFGLMVLIAMSSAVADFPLRIEQIKLRSGLIEKPAKPNEKLYGVFEEVAESNGRTRWEIPSVEVTVRARAAFADSALFARAHFFERGRLVATVDHPAEGYLNTEKPYGLPTAFPMGKKQTVFFPIPAELRGRSWSVVVVLGNSKGAVARAFPGNAVAATFNYPERGLVEGGGRSTAPDVAAPGSDGIIEYVAKTRSTQQPQITLLFRLPPGVTEMSELRGLLASVRIGHSLEDVREAFLRETSEVNPGTTMELAKKYKLGVLCWGSRTLWTRDRNAEDLPAAQRKAEDAEFDLVAEGWERGLESMAAKYGIPQANILMEGLSQSGQWSHRLALRKPARFLAVQAHVASSYDVPTREAASVFWLITTGEQEPGCEGAVAFFERCRSLGYPMIFKAEPGLGHEESRLADALKYRFFDWVLRNFTEAEFDPNVARTRILAGFRKPAFLGDFGTQEIVPEPDRAELGSDVPVPLPTRAIAEAWAGERLP